MIKIKRAYAEPDKSDGVRILVDRLWPSSGKGHCADNWAGQKAREQDQGGGVKRNNTFLVRRECPAKTKNRLAP